MGFESTVPLSPTTGILGMPTRGRGAISLKHSSSYFDEVLVISSCSSLGIESNIRLKTSL